MLMAQTVQDVMTPNPRTVPADASLTEAARQMREADVGAVIVMDKNKVCGIVTDRDIAVRAVAEGKDPSSTKAKEVASTDLTTLDRSASADDAVRMMREKKIRRLPVVENGKPVGIVSLGDLAVERDPKSALGEISGSAPNN
jgi:CBS domain-containing protein